MDCEILLSVCWQEPKLKILSSVLFLSIFCLSTAFQINLI